MKERREAQTESKDGKIEAALFLPTFPLVRLSVCLWLFVFSLLQSVFATHTFVVGDANPTFLSLFFVCLYV